MGVLDKVVDAASKMGSKVATAPSSEAAGIKAKSDNVRDYMNATAKEPDAPKADPVTSEKDKLHPTSKYGDNAGEKRIDVSDMTKPLVQSFKKGTVHVPKTGLAKVHKGEAVIPAKENPLSDMYAGVKSMGKDKTDNSSAKPADLAAAQATPGTSTSTGGATATRNTGAATGGAVTITMSGSSSTDTSTTTGAGAGKGAAKDKSKGGADDKTPHVYNITVNSTGKSGDAIDGDRSGAPDDDLPSHEKGIDYVPKTGPAILHQGEKVVPAKENKVDKTYDLVKGMGKHEAAPKKEIAHIKTSKAHGGGYVHEHHHTRPEHHPVEHHVSKDQDAMVDHMMQHMGDQNPGEADADAGQSGVPVAPPAAGAAPVAPPMATPGA
jgi:hypothetical protein